MRIPTLNEIFTDWLTGGGIFGYLDNLDVPWKVEDDTETPITLDIDYHGCFSGDKPVSPIVLKMLTDGELSAENAQKLADVAYMRYGKNWHKLWEMLLLEYNPIENYAMIEREAPAQYTITHTPAETTIENTPAEIEDESEATVGLYGVDSATDAPSDKSKTKTFNTVKAAGEIKSTVDTAGSDVYTKQSDRSLTRSGNIGVTTSQQMMESEFVLREKYNFFEQVYKDLDKVLTLPIYQ